MAEPLRLGILATHPVQYYAPWYRALAARSELDVAVHYAHRQTAAGQAAAGFGVGFEWDVPLLDGYRYEFLPNLARSPGTSRFAGCDTPSIADAIRRGLFDVFLVHGWGSMCYWQAMRACWQQRVPLMVRGDSHLLTPRSRLKKWLKQIAYARFIPRFDAYLCVGERARDYYLAYGAEPKRMVVCPHFVDNDRFAAAADKLRPLRESLRAKWNIPSDALCVLFCGKFMPLKRANDLVEAAKRLLRVSGNDQAIHLLFVGSGILDRDLRDSCRVVFDASPPHREHNDAGVAPSEGVRPAASFAGFLNQSSITEAYAAADVLALPSSSETWGLVVNEAMACGIPAVVSDQVGCAPDLISQGETGFTYQCGDVDHLARILGQLIADPDLAPRLGDAARRQIKRYSIAVAVDATIDTVQKLAANRMLTGSTS